MDRQTDERFGGTAVQDGGDPAQVASAGPGRRAVPAFLAAGPAEWPEPPVEIPSLAPLPAFPAEGDAASDAAARPSKMVNPLLVVAAPLLDLAARLRDRVSHGNPEGLRDPILAELRRFEEEAAAAGMTAAEVRVGRFALCATLDDVVRATPWGARCRWAREGLVAVVDRDANRPDHFFELLDTMLGDPRLHRRELELFYACLSLGFEGKFRDHPRGAHDLAHLRDELYRVLRRARGEHERALSPSWQGIGERFRPLGMVLPTWAVLLAAAAVLGGLFVHLSVTLTAQADPVAARLAALLPDRPIEIARVAPPPPPGAGPALVGRVTALLGPEIRSGAVEVLAGEDGALVIRLDGTGMFATGSDAVRARYRAVVDRVGQALGPEAGHVAVIGHGDDALPRPGRPGTPQALSEARAEVVRKLLERILGPARLSAEGRGDSEPVPVAATPSSTGAASAATSSTGAGRGASRRVDVRLYPQ